jgi:hypothetical protein
MGSKSYEGGGSRPRQAGQRHHRPRRLIPTFGALELTAVVDRLATVRDLDTEAWSLPGAEILQFAFEVPRTTDALLPRAMHPAIPPYATIWVTRYTESPVGPFALA